MKFIHAADIHLGSKIEAKLPPEKTEERKAEVRLAFKNMVEKAGLRARTLSSSRATFSTATDRSKRIKIFFTAS